MADISEVGALLHVHKLLTEHGDLFPNLKSNVLNKLREIEADHNPKKEPASVVEEEPLEIAPPDDEPVDETSEETQRRA